MPKRVSRISPSVATGRLSTKALRLAALVSSAGIVLQMGGCAANELLAGLANTVANRLINDLVFGAFNVLP